MIRLDLGNGRIVARTPFECKDVCAAIPTRKWDRLTGAWTYAATPWAARTAIEKLMTWRAATNPGMPFEVDPRVVGLGERAISVEEFIRSLDGRPTSRAPGMKSDPWRHQWVGVEAIKAIRRVYLAWDMGTGKTYGSLAAISTIAAGDKRPVLIVCPSSVVPVWAGEFEKHVEDWRSRFVVCSTRDKDSVQKRAKLAQAAIDEAAATGRTAVIVTNYESFIQDGSPMLVLASATTWAAVVFDEAHRLGTPGSKTTKAAVTRIAPRAIFLWLLSGTPMRNSPLDLYSQCGAIDAGIFGSNQEAFLARYSVRDFWGAVVGLANERELKEKFALVAMRVDKRMVLDLPPVVKSFRRFSLSPEAKRIYDELERELCATVGENVVAAPNEIVRMLRAQQITSGYAVTETADGDRRVESIDGGKRAELAEVLQEIATNEPVVVFCRFDADLADVHAIAAAAGRGSAELSGKRNELAEWQTTGSTRGDVLAVQIRSGGVGVDLTMACVAVFYSVGFSLADYEQACARVDRPGQTRPVTLVNLVASGTIDEAVFGSIEKKRDVVEGVLDYLRGRKGTP